MLLPTLRMMSLVGFVGCYPQFDVVRDDAGEHDAAMPGSSTGQGGKSGAAGSAGAPGSAGVAGSGAGGESVSVAGEGGAAGVPAACVRGQQVLTGQVANARDLGGLPVAGGRAVACGAIYRGGPMKALTAQGCEQVSQLGLKTVIDLRVAGERESNPNSACVSAEQVPAPLPIPYELSAVAYLRDLNESASIAAAFRAFGDESAYPIYFHCTYGRDRTGVLGALLLLTLGVAPSDIMQDYMLSESSVGAYPASLQAVLDDIAARGGAEAVLLGFGITAEEIATLRARALVGD